MLVTCQLASRDIIMFYRGFFKVFINTLISGILPYSFLKIQFLCISFKFFVFFLIYNFILSNKQNRTDSNNNFIWTTNLACLLTLVCLVFIISNRVASTIEWARLKRLDQEISKH